MTKKKKKVCIHIYTHTCIINIYTHTHASHAHHGDMGGSQGHSIRRIQSLDKVRGGATDMQGADRWAVGGLSSHPSPWNRF